MRYKIFDPTICKPEDYRTKYPELADVEEFGELSARTLIFVWWYANQSSDLVIGIADRKKRVAEALTRSGWKPSRTENDKILNLQFDDRLAVAIERMGQFDPGIRFRSWRMLNNIMQQYEELITQGSAAFTKKEKVGSGETAVEVEVTDHNQYVTTSAKIAQTIPLLLEKLETGFGISISQDDQEEAVGGAMHDWHMNRSDDN